MKVNATVDGVCGGDMSESDTGGGVNGCDISESDTVGWWWLVVVMCGDMGESVTGGEGGGGGCDDSGKECIYGRHVSEGRTLVVMRVKVTVLLGVMWARVKVLSFWW